MSLDIFAYKELKGIIEEPVSSTSEDTVIRKTDETAKSIKGLADELTSATKALDEYNKKLKEGGEKGDAFKSYADAYKNAVEMYEKGLTGSNQYMSAIELIFGKVEDYEAAGKLLGNAFVKSMFEGGGDDYGANAANYIRTHINEFEGVQITQGDNGTFGLMVTDMEKFADYTGLSADALWTLIDALDIFDSKTTYTRDQLFDFMGLEDDGRDKFVNLTALINDLAGQGKSAREIKGIVDAIKELAETDGNITISEPENLDQTIDDVVELNKEAEKDKDMEVVLTSNSEEFFDGIKKEINQINGSTIYIGLKYKSSPDNLHGVRGRYTYASGTKSARGGLSLVNEEGAEIIYANGKAWIAGGGDPTITNLDPIPEKFFTVYEDIRDKLIARGVKPEEIAFIHDANTEEKKKDLFGKVRSGKVRVLMGSTSKMGAGTNVQDRLIALHDLDAPWRPGDLEQRSGRIVRQGNQNEKVHIYRYVTESTFDAYLWQTLEQKQKFISQIMTSKSPVRSCEDVDETTLSFAEIKALCAGDERIKEKMDLDVDVAKLKLMKASYQNQQFRLEDNILKNFPQQIKQYEEYISGFQADIQTAKDNSHPPEGFAGMTVRGDFLTDKENAGAALIDAMKDVKIFMETPIGYYRGFDMSLSVEDFGKKYVLTLKGKMSHKVELGKDPRGNLIRIDNVLDSITKRLNDTQLRLDNVKTQMENAKAELGKPFPQEEELKIKSARLTELNIALNMDKPEAPSAENAIAKSSRPSIMDKLQMASAKSKTTIPKATEKKKTEEVL